MEIELKESFNIIGTTFKEVRDQATETIREFLKGTKGVRYEVTIEPSDYDSSIGGFHSRTSAWTVDVTYISGREEPLDPTVHN